MACEGCNTKSKIIFGIASVLGLVGVILLLLAGTAGSAGSEVDFVVENEQSFTVNMPQDHCGFSVYLKDSEDCEAVKAATTVKDPHGDDVFFFGDCDAPQEEWAKEKDPAIRKLGWFFQKEELGVKVVGDYSVTSSSPLWAMDWCGQIGEAVSGFFAMLGIFVLAVIVFVVSCICCCIGCCCMGQEKGPNVVVVQGGTQ